MFIRQYKKGAGGDYWEKEWASTSAETIMAQNRKDYLYGFLTRELPATGIALEVGIGLGNWCRLFPHLTWHGIDSEPRVIARLHKEAPFIKARVGDGTALPYKNDTFDVYCSWGVIEHGEQERAMAEEAVRVLKPGGKAYFSVPYLNPLRLLILPWMILRNQYNKMRGLPFHQKLYTRRHLVKTLRRAGLREIRTVPIGNRWNCHMVLLEGRKE